MISFKHKGDFSNLEKTLKLSTDHNNFIDILKKYGQEGVDVLSANTPRDTGKTASSWYYKINENNGSYTITWNNSNINDGVNIAIILQYGHGTRNGGYVEGINYINPSLKPIFDKLANELWREVSK